MKLSVETPMKELLIFIKKLEKSKIWYRLESFRDSIMVIVAVPGEYWEIEYFTDGTIEIERFYSSGKIDTSEVLETLENIIQTHSE